MSTAKNIQTITTMNEVISWVQSNCAPRKTEVFESGLEIARTLENLGIEQSGQIAAFLSFLDPLTDSELKVVDSYFDPEIVALYRNVIKINQLSELLVGGNNSQASIQEENLRKMLIAMVDDVRVVLIVLASQLCILKSSKNRSDDYKKQQAKVTRQIYAPLANRLGIWQLKWEMEDYAFRYLNPKTYKSLVNLLQEKRRAREEYIEKFISDIKLQLKGSNIEAEIQGRPKHIYSIWKKMQTKGMEFKQLWDLQAVRILVDGIDDCYAALSIVHTNWDHFPQQFSDYIATPKENNYQSIHTVVEGPDGKSVEVQIRTHAMHDISEIGGAAHWRYKEKIGQSSSIDTKIIWLRRLLEWKDEILESVDTAKENQQIGPDQLTDLRIDNRVYVFTPKGTIVDLPQGSTPIDFAYAIHTEVGHHTRGAKVNGKMVSLSYQLKTGEQVHIQTVKTGGPSRDWIRNDLGFVNTNRARSRITQWFKQENYTVNLSEGKAMLDRELHRLGFEDLSYEKICNETHFKTVDDMLAAIGAADYKLSKALYPFKQFKPRITEIDPASTKHTSVTQKLDSQKSDSLRVDGVGNLLTHMAKCCQPVPGDQIVGYITVGRGVTIHRKKCMNIQNIEPDHIHRLVNVEWGKQESGAYTLELTVTAYHRSGLLHDVTESLRANQIDVLKVNMTTDDDHVSKLNFLLDVKSATRPDQIISRLSSIQNVFEVSRKL